jgi:hypothetical protein
MTKVMGTLHEYLCAFVSDVTWIPVCICQWRYMNTCVHLSVTYAGILLGGGGGGQQIQLRTEGRENGDGGDGSPLVRGSAQFAKEWNPSSYSVVTEVFSTELGIRLSFVKTSEFRGGGGGFNPEHPRPVRYWNLFCLAEFSKEWEMFQTKVAEKIKTHILFRYVFPKIVPFTR